MRRAVLPPSLFPRSRSVVRDDGPVVGGRGSEPACKPRRLTTSDYVAFVAKRVVPEPENTTGAISSLRALTEFAVAEWSVALGVHVPEACFLDFDGELWIGSRAFLEFRPTSSSSVAQVRPSDAVSRLLVLDTLIGNQDRHAGNVLLVPDADDGDLNRLYAIDHERSAMGFHDREGDFTATYAEVAHFHPVLRDAVRREDALAAAERVRSALSDRDTLVGPLVSGNTWCKMETSVIGWLEEILVARVERLPELVSTVCDKLRVPE